MFTGSALHRSDLKDSKTFGTYQCFTVCSLRSLALIDTNALVPPPPPRTPFSNSMAFKHSVKDAIWGIWKIGVGVLYSVR